MQQNLDEALESVNNSDTEYRELINQNERAIQRLTQRVVNFEQLFDLLTAALDGKTDLDEKLVKTVNAEESSTLIEDVKGKIQRFCEIESVVEITRTEIIHSKQEESKAIERIKELKEDLISKESQIKEKLNTIDKISNERFVLEQKCKELQKQLGKFEKQTCELRKQLVLLKKKECMLWEGSQDIKKSLIVFMDKLTNTQNGLFLNKMRLKRG